MASPTELTPEQKQRYWSHQITQFETSDSTRKGFCKAHGLSYDQFQYWYRKLRLEDSDKSSFIPVNVSQTDVRTAELDLTASEHLNNIICTVELAQGIRLLCHDTSSLDTIIRRLAPCN